MDLICSGEQDKIPYLPQTGREENKSGTCRDIRPAGYRGDDNQAMDKVYSASLEVISKMENSIKH